WDQGPRVGQGMGCGYAWDRLRGGKTRADCPADASFPSYLAPYRGSGFHGNFMDHSVRRAQCPNSSSTTPVSRYTPRPRKGWRAATCGNWVLSQKSPAGSMNEPKVICWPWCVLVVFTWMR